MKCCTCHAKSSQQTWRSDAPKCNPSHRLTALMKMSLVLRLPRKMHLCRSCSNVPHLPSLLEMLQNPHVLVTFDKVHNPLRLPRETTSERPKMVRTPSFLYIFTSKCASRHYGVHDFDISTSKSGPSMVFFVHFDFEMCFAPQWRARHLNFQKWYEREVFLAFSLANVLRATAACAFSTSQLPKLVRSLCVLYILTSKCAWRHNGVQFFISHLARWLRTRRFSEPTSRPSEKKHSVQRLFYLFAHLHLLSSGSSSSLIFSLLLFSLLLFSSLWLFPPLLFICPYCRKFDF